MTVLVTGGAGYIGSHMVLRLLEDGEQVVVLDNLSTGYRWLVDRRAELIVGEAGDVAPVTALMQARGINSILHFAGSIVVPESVENPLKYYANNTATTRNLLEAAVRSGVQNFIFSSTAAVYGMTGNQAVSEHAPVNPMSPYGRSKLMSEWMIADVAAAYPLRYGVLRYFNVAGGDPEGRTGQTMERATHLIKVACQTALGQRPRMDIFGTDYDTPDGTCVRDFIHVSDLADAHARLLGYLREGGENVTLNCGYGRGYSVRDVIATVKQVSGIDFPVRELPRRPGDPASVVAAATKLRSLLDWQPKHADLHRIVEAAYHWESYLATREDRPEVA